MSTALLLILAAALVGFPSTVAAVALPCVFFWSVFRPGSMMPPTVFALGLLQDLLTLAPLGAGVLTLLMAHGLALRWRRSIARQKFLTVWLIFWGFALGAVAMGWALQAALSLRLPPPGLALHLWAFTVGLYPLLAFVLTRMHEAMRRAEATA